MKTKLYRVEVFFDNFPEDGWRPSYHGPAFRAAGRATPRCGKHATQLDRCRAKKYLVKAIEDASDTMHYRMVEDV